MGGTVWARSKSSIIIHDLFGRDKDEKTRDFDVTNFMLRNLITIGMCVRMDGGPRDYVATFITIANNIIVYSWNGIEVTLDSNKLRRLYPEMSGYDGRVWCTSKLSLSDQHRLHDFSGLSYGFHRSLESELHARLSVNLIEFLLCWQPTLCVWLDITNLLVTQSITLPLQLRVFGMFVWYFWVQWPEFWLLRSRSAHC